ncbi:MAG: AAA-like domain-containing protein [Candidatus Poribacteria bacterium]|nr:AAA-like domain-containing protein [Candidatus Poribacteria bacterium]
MRTFGTQGPVDPNRNYIVNRSEKIKDFIHRVKEGRYIVIFAPRQTGKTTFFQRALDILSQEEKNDFPIQLNFEVYEDCTASVFYNGLYEDILEEIENTFQQRGQSPPETLTQFLRNTEITDHLSMQRFFRRFGNLLNAEFGEQRVILIIDEFDGIPSEALRGFLHSLRRIYLTTTPAKCPHSVSIIGVKSIHQLNYDRSISPFNIQDELNLPNFTSEEVHDLLRQYTDEVGQAFAPEVVNTLYSQTAGQPFLVNRFAQIITTELDIPKTETVGMVHFATAHTRLLDERNANIDHLLSNIRRNVHFETVLMQIVSYENSVRFNPDNDIIDELVTYGVIKRGDDRRCEIVNPIYLYRILQAFKPIVNGLERDYFPEGASESEYLTPTGHIRMERLLDNFSDFVARAGFKILQVPDTPQEFIGQHLLFAYLDQFVESVAGVMYMEVPTGRGRIDLLILHKGRKYIVETKIWGGDRHYQGGKKQLAAYMKLETASEGYYVVFDHREMPESGRAPVSRNRRMETETVTGVKIRSYVIPVVQERPSDAHRVIE